MANNTENSGEFSLFTQRGERKYLSRLERERFFSALEVLKDPRDRTFVAMIYWTGCRPSEALAITALHVEPDEAFVIIRSLKKRGRTHFRTIPVPNEFIKEIDCVHSIRKARCNPDGGNSLRLWGFCRTTGWRKVKLVMQAAELSGVKATGRGLRHSFGTNGIICKVPESVLQGFLGHTDIKTTAIYTHVMGAEQRAIAKRMWH